ncbi:MAG: hypothetical protein KC502_22205, partial [Myxococcales bacterium]|nr:hypothetical protein [Myxococcales bacterium]
LALPDAHRMTPLAALSGKPARDSSKRVLRHLAERYVPKSIVSAPKQGFVAPLGTWLATDLRDRTSEAIGRLGHRGVIRPERADQMMKDHTSKRRDYSHNLWALVVLDDWFARRIDKLDLPEIPEDAACETHIAS